MLDKIKVVPLAAESFGVRSMCTFVETPNIGVLLDAGVSLCPNRFGLMPHPIEFEAIAKLRVRIAEAADRADVVTVSHYHFDHHTPSFQDWVVNWTEAEETAKQIYQDKVVLVKNFREKINASQRQRGWLFRKTGGKFARKIEVADGKEFVFGSTVLRFSEPVFHGPESGVLGWTLMVLVECDGERFMFAPDVQGPMATNTLELIEEARPQVLMIGGPPFYLGGLRVSEAELQIGVKNLMGIIANVPVTILEHHTLRDEQWRQKTQQVYDAAQEMGHTVMTAAEFAGQENIFLEFNRKRLFADFPPSEAFKKWMRNDLAAENPSKPPV